MVKKALHSLLLRRHFWRYVTFDEMVEMYISRMLRMAALHMAGSFIAIYLFQIGYSIAQIAFVWAGFYFFKTLVSLPIAAFVAKVGPKHGILVSNFLYIPAMVGFALLPIMDDWILIPIMALQGVSAALYAIAHNINFSKIKSLAHAGKEIGYMNIFEKLTAGLSPLIGGVVAFLWGPQVVIVVAALLFACAALPLMRTGEQLKTGQVLHLRGFPWKLFMRHSLAQFSTGFDVYSSGVVWSLFIAIVIVGIGTNNEVYAISGVLLSVVCLTAIIASYIYGKIIDNSFGERLMRIGAVVNVLVYLTRPFAATPVAAAGINAVNELATTGIMMPYTRAVYDNADISGRRTTYLGVCEAVANIGAGVGAIALGCLALAIGEESALRYYFFIAAGAALLILTAKFPLYKKP